MTSIQTISQCLGNSGAKCMRQCLSNGVVSNCSELWRVFGLRKQTSACLPVILKSPAVCMLKEKRSVDNGRIVWQPFRFVILWNQIFWEVPKLPAIPMISMT